MEKKYADQRRDAKACPLGACAFFGLFFLFIGAVLFPDCVALACSVEGSSPSNCPKQCTAYSGRGTATCKDPIPDPCPQAQRTDKVWGFAPGWTIFMALAMPAVGVLLYFKQLQYLDGEQAKEVAAQQQLQRQPGLVPQQMQQMQQQQPMMQQQQQPPQTMPVQVPPGVAAGSVVMITAPNGQQLQVLVPAGLAPGQVFNVQVG